MSNPSTDSISLLLVDDHPIVREGLRTLLGDEPDLEILGEAADGKEALTAIAELKPDVVLMDLMLPELDGIEVSRRTLKDDPDAKIIILTSSFGADRRVTEAIQAGVLGFLLKDVAKTELMAAIRNAARGKPTLHPEVQGALVRDTASPPVHSQLTEREMDVLQRIAAGDSNKAIAAKLFLTEGTVKGYVSIVLSKLGVTDRTQAALYAVRNGLTESP